MQTAPRGPLSAASVAAKKSRFRGKQGEQQKDFFFFVFFFPSDSANRPFAFVCRHRTAASFLSEPSLPAPPPPLHSSRRSKSPLARAQTNGPDKGGGVGGAIKNGGESDRLIREAESAESALPYSHPRAYSRVFPGEALGSHSFISGRTGMK